MPVHTATIDVSTRGMTDIHDLTGEVARAVGDSGLASGTATVFAPGSTAGITTVEFEPGMQRDIPDYLEKIAPYGGSYAHHETWHDDNGAAHVRAALVGPSVTVRYALTHGIEMALEYRVDFERGDVKLVSIQRNFDAFPKIWNLRKWFVTQQVTAALIGRF